MLKKDLVRVIMFSIIQLIIVFRFYIDWKHTKSDNDYDIYDLCIHSINMIYVIGLLYYYYYHNIHDSFQIKLVVFIILLGFNIELVLHYYTTKL